MEKKKKDYEKNRMTITLTEDELETLRRFAILKDRPVATTFLSFLREAGVFVLLENTCDVLEEAMKKESDFTIECIERLAKNLDLEIITLQE